jgi:hypothetical protein
MPPREQLTAAPRYLAHFARDLEQGLRNESHQSSLETYRLVRHGYVASRGLSRRAWRWFYGRVRPVQLPAAQLDPTLRSALTQLRRDGLARVPGYLSQSTVAALAAHFRELPAHPLSKPFAKLPAVKLADAVHTPRLAYDTRAVLAAPRIAELLADRSLQTLAAAYLGCQPIFAGVHAWWSLADEHADEEALSDAAQLFHFDCDWPAFVKFFFYLTDVEAEDGPFAYVLGTHEEKREWRDGRFSDAYIETTYGERVQRIAGRAGDLIAADTVGYHKGERVRAGPRLMLQIEFCVARLGAGFQYQRYPRAARPGSEYPHTFDVFCEDT